MLVCAVDKLSKLGAVLDEVALTLPFPGWLAEELRALVVNTAVIVDKLSEALEPTGLELTGMLDKLAGPVVVVAASVATVVDPARLELKAAEDEDAVPGGTACPPPLELVACGTFDTRRGDP